MNVERDPSAVLRAWLREDSPNPADPLAVRERVLERLPSTRQGARWRPLHRRPSPDTPSGRRPTTMFSAAHIAALTAILALGGGLAIASIAFDPAGGPVPGAPAASMLDVAVHVTGEDGEPTYLIDPTQEKVGDVTQFRGGLFTQTSTMDDPRVSGELTFAWSGDVYGVPFIDAATEWGTMRIANEGGTWEGPCSGGQWGDTTSILSCWLPGSDDYEGLTYYRQFDWPPEVGVRGVIFPGVPPTEFPALPASVTE